MAGPDLLPWDSDSSVSVSAKNKATPGRIGNKPASRTQTSSLSLDYGTLCGARQW
jgi:hypothetical protein